MNATRILAACATAARPVTLAARAYVLQIFGASV